MTVLALAVFAGSLVVLRKPRETLTDRTGRWEVRATRDPEPGPA